MVFNLKDLSFASTPLLAAKANILSDCTLTQPTKWTKDDNRSPYFPPSASLPQHNHLHMSKKTALTRTNTVQGQGPSQLQEWRKTVAPLDSPIASWPILAFENLQAFAFAAGEAVFSTEFLLWCLSQLPARACQSCKMLVISTEKLTPVFRSDCNPPPNAIHSILIVNKLGDGGLPLHIISRLPSME